MEFRHCYNAYFHWRGAPRQWNVQGLESYSSGRRGVTRNLVGHEILPPGFKSLTLRQKRNSLCPPDKGCFFSTKSVLTDGINPSSMDEITLWWNPTSLGERTDLISSAKQISSELARITSRFVRFHWKQKWVVVWFAQRCDRYGRK